MEIRADYIDDQNYLHIDMWKSEDDNEEGKTIAIICCDTLKVYFIDNTLRSDHRIKETINNTLSELNKTKQNGKENR
jgi:hypothetical protein